MKLIATALALVMASASASAQCDVYLKLNDKNQKHPRIESITFPGDVNTREMYNSIYGHGGVIENPWIAYRIYMDNRQSLDLYVKQTPQLELDKTGFYTTPEQLEQGFGRDVLWAGKSIGAGSFNGWQNGSPVTIDTVATRSQTVISNHQLLVADKDWIFNGHPIQMKQKYTVFPDKRDMEVEIKLEGYKPSDLFCVGIQKLETANQGFITPKGVAASWGTNIPEKKLPELVETVGLGLIVDKANVVKVVEDELNYIVLVKPDKHGCIRYTTTACGSREKEGFPSPTVWFEYVKRLAK